MADIFNFPRRETDVYRPAQEGDSPTPQVLSNFQEFRELVDSGKVEFFITIGALADGKKFGFVAGILDPTLAAGMLEHVKIQIIAG